MRRLMSGNAALAEAAVLSGCTCYFGYPITPQNELTEYMAKRLGEAGGVFIQSESEIAAINLVLGAAVAGARAVARRIPRRIVRESKIVRGRREEFRVVSIISDDHSFLRFGLTYCTFRAAGSGPKYSSLTMAAR